MVRFKNRYLLCEIIFENGKISESLNLYQILNAIKESLSTNFGVFGLGVLAISLQVKYFNPFTGLAIVRVNRDYMRLVWACVSLITAINKRICMVKVVHVGGTIKLVQSQAIKYNQTIISRLRSDLVLSDAKANLLLQETVAEISTLD
ncbi:RNA-binding protein pop5 [Batrachochytrium dendrobatidis]|nr:RNA-binding protein pop5 [Batrachochytrium dendrobatidis]KAK5671759.1 RNA-binding protein pop5 [Batrachochytrium dendrobatidis]